MAKFIRFPFGVSGDRTTIPDTADPGGAVSYAQGFGPDYELDLSVDPGAKPVPRPETNQLYFDLSDNIRQYQLNGTPEWVDASQNGGTPVSYPVNAVVRRGGLVYRSSVATNIVEPGTDPAQWAVDQVAGPASTTTAGLVQLATVAEARARTATDRAVTPEGLGTLLEMFANNPVYPEVLGALGIFTLANPAGNVRVAAGNQWVHRGFNTYTSAQTDLPTVASKTYHLRWTPQSGFSLYDLSSGAYNPSSVLEGDVSFDSTYDSMLVARVVTSPTNVATITPLVNRNKLSVSGQQSVNAVARSSGALSATVAINQARRLAPVMSGYEAVLDATSGTIDEVDVGVTCPTRYSLGLYYRRDYFVGDGCQISYAGFA